MANYTQNRGYMLLELRKLAAVGTGQTDQISDRVVVPCKCRLLAVYGTVVTLANTGATIMVEKGVAATAAGTQLLNSVITDPASGSVWIGSVKVANADIDQGTIVSLRCTTDADANLTEQTVTLLLAPLD